jgi:hypothetical protein
VIVLEPGLSEELESAALSTSAHIRLLAEPGIDANLFNALRAELIGASGELKARLALAVPGTASPAPDASIQAMVQAERFSTAGPRPTSVQQNVPAWLVFGMFFVVASLSSLFVQERGSGALGRLQSLGVSRTMLLASKALPYLGVNALQALLMLAAGIWFMPLIGGDALSLAGIHWGALLLSLAAVSLRRGEPVARAGLPRANPCAGRHARADGQRADGGGGRHHGAQVRHAGLHAAAGRGLADELGARGAPDRAVARRRRGRCIAADRSAGRVRGRHVPSRSLSVSQAHIVSTP